MVVTFLPCVWDRLIWHERTALPSICTVQAPHSADAAAELGAGQLQMLAHHPQQRRAGFSLDADRLAVDDKSDRSHRFPPLKTVYLCRADLNLWSNLALRNVDGKSGSAGARREPDLD